MEMRIVEGMGRRTPLCKHEMGFWNYERKADTQMYIEWDRPGNRIGCA